jgi:uncharacterized protein YndB with AHSA1/START domain
MADIYHQIGVRADIEKAYRAITTLDGLSGWWTEARGDTGENGSLSFHFNDISIEMTIIQLMPAKKVVWQCTEKEGEWKDTMITFDIEQDRDQVFINFSHKGWAAQTSLCAHCNTKWAVFLLSLKDYLETGKGQPFPHDVHVNHTDF